MCLASCRYFTVLMSLNTDIDGRLPSVLADRFLFEIDGLTRREEHRQNVSIERVRIMLVGCREPFSYAVPRVAADTMFNGFRP